MTRRGKAPCGDCSLMPETENRHSYHAAPATVGKPSAFQQQMAGTVSSRQEGGFGIMDLSKVPGADITRKPAGGLAFRLTAATRNFHLMGDVSVQQSWKARNRVPCKLAIIAHQLGSTSAEISSNFQHEIEMRVHRREHPGSRCYNSCLTQETRRAGAVGFRGFASRGRRLCSLQPGA